MQTITALFDDYDDAADAVGELESMGVPPSDLSIIANNADGRHSSAAAEDAASGAGIGAVVGGAGGLATGLGAIAIPGVGPVVAAGWRRQPRARPRAQLLVERPAASSAV